MKGRPQVVIDTNVIVAALRSRNGAANELLRQVVSGKFDLHISLPLFVQYQDVLSRQVDQLGYGRDEIAEFLAALDSLASQHDVHYLLRPELLDSGDDMVLEAAFAASADYIITHNIRDFAGVERFGIRAVTPVQFLRLLERTDEH
jgi:putative PIN family toxin of toxin-antitoxin system